MSLCPKNVKNLHFWALAFHRKRGIQVVRIVIIQLSGTSFKILVYASITNCLQYLKYRYHSKIVYYHRKPTAKYDAMCVL
jgi:hypothetical protein